MSAVTLGFTGLTIDRADNLRLSDQAIDALAAQQDARLMQLTGFDPLLAPDGRLGWTDLDVGPADLIFLGLAGTQPLFAPIAPGDDGGDRPPIFAVLGAMQGEDAALWGMARSLIAWHARHRFCSNCGAPTLPFRAGWGRRCPACDGEHFPRVDPVVIMLAEYRGKVLVGRSGRFPPGRFSALAGYVEPGESLEEAVVRELKEEAGVEASNVRYLVSQPWPLSGALMMACIAEVASDLITLDPTELEEAIWVDRKEMAAVLAEDPSAPFLAPPHYAIAHSLMTLWLEGG